MKLRTKSFLLIAVCLLVVTIAMLAVIRLVALKGFDELEEWQARQALSRVQKILHYELDGLGRSVEDLSTWDALERAVRQKDAGFVRTHFTYSVGENFRWDHCVINREDGIFYSRSFDRTKRALTDVPASAAAILAGLPGSPELSGPVQSFCVIEGDVYLVALAAIRRAGSADKPAGTMTVARRLDPQEVQRLGRLADVVLQIFPTDFRALARHGDPRMRTRLERPEEGKIAGLAMLYDATGRPNVTVRTVLDADLREQGQIFSHVLMGLVILGSAVICLLIDRAVIRPLSHRLGRLSTGMRHVQRSGNLTERLPTKGKDEIAQLGQEANRLLTSVDITQRSLERVNAEMQQRVAERTAALAEANAALEADIRERIKAEQERERLREQLLHAHKMEAVGTLAGGIAHDFNNILTGILGHAQILAADLPLTSPARRSIDQVIAAAERAASLVRQILAFSRQAPGERRVISVGQVAREALSLLRAALPANIQVRFEVAASPDTVVADPTQLHQVFMNLGANAGQAIGSRGGDIDIVLERCTLGVGRIHLGRSLPAGDYLCIRVTDTGCGMSPEVIDRIFDPFFSTKPVNEGTGLGLAVVHGIVADHGGAIEVESRVGKGTTFRILLPASQAGVPAALPAEPAPLAGGSERILLVDDEEMVLSVMTGSLRRLGYAVTAELNSLAALKKLQESPDAFDLVITDQTMPHLSGLGLNAEIKAFRPDLPVILATGFSPEVSGHDAASLDVAAIIDKPIDFGNLTTLMREALDRAKYPDGCRV